MSNGRKTKPPILVAAMELVEKANNGLLEDETEDAESRKEKREILEQAIKIVEDAERIQAEWDGLQAERDQIHREKNEGIEYLKKERKRYAKTSPKWAAYSQLINIIEKSGADKPLFDIIKKDSDEMRKVVVGIIVVKGEEKLTTYTISGMPEASIQEILYANLGFKKKIATSKSNLIELRKRCRIIKKVNQPPFDFTDENQQIVLNQKDNERDNLKKLISDYPEQNYFEVGPKKYYVRPSESEEHPGKLRILELNNRIGKGGFGEFYKMDTWKSETWKKYQTSHARGVKVSAGKEANRIDLKHESKLGRKEIPATKMKKIISTDSSPKKYILLPMAVKPGKPLNAVIEEQRELKILQQQKQPIPYGPLNQDQLDRLAIDSMRNLQEKFHDRGLVHLDVKPHNIVIDRSDPNNPKAEWIDFGLTKRKGEITFPSGTRRYSAPEIWDYNIHTLSADYTLDMFSLGITLMEFLLQPKYNAKNKQSDEGFGMWAMARMSPKKYYNIKALCPILWQEIQNVAAENHITKNLNTLSNQACFQLLLKKYGQLTYGGHKYGELFSLYLHLLKKNNDITDADIEAASQYLQVIEKMCVLFPEQRISLQQAINEFEEIRLENASDIVIVAYSEANKARNRLRDMRKHAENKFDYSAIRKEIEESLEKLEEKLNISMEGPMDAYAEYVHTLGIHSLIDFFNENKDNSWKFPSYKDFILHHVDTVIDEFKANFALAQHHNNQKIEIRYQKFILEADKGLITFDDMANLNKQNKETLLGKDNSVDFDTEDANFSGNVGLHNDLKDFDINYDPLTEVERSNLPLYDPIQQLKNKNTLHLANILQEVSDHTNQNIIVNKNIPMSTLLLMKEKFEKKANLSNPNVLGDSTLFGYKYEKELIYRAVYNLDKYLEQGYRFTSLKQLLIFQQKKDIMKYCQEKIEEINKIIRHRTNSEKPDPTIPILYEKRKAFFNLQLTMKLYLKAYDMTVPAAIAARRRESPSSMKYFTDKLKRFSLLSHSGDIYHKICILLDPDTFLKPKKMEVKIKT